MAKARIIASNSLRKKRPKIPIGLIIALVLNLALSAAIALKVFGVI